MFLPALIIVNVWGAIGEGMIIFLAGLTAVPKDYYEAATLDGATGLTAVLPDYHAAGHPQHLLPGVDVHHQCLPGI